MPTTGGGDTVRFVRFVRVRLGFYRDKDMFSDKTDIKTDKILEFCHFRRMAKIKIEMVNDEWE